MTFLAAILLTLATASAPPPKEYDIYIVWGLTPSSARLCTILHYPCKSFPSVEKCWQRDFPVKSPISKIWKDIDDYVRKATNEEKPTWFAGCAEIPHEPAI